MANGTVSVKGFLIRSLGVALGVGEKREGNLALSSDSSKFRTMSVLSHWL